MDEEQHKTLHGVLRPGAYYLTVRGQPKPGWHKARLTLLPRVGSSVEQLVALGSDDELCRFPLISVSEPRRYALTVTSVVRDVYWRVNIETQLAADQRTAANARKESPCEPPKNENS